LFAIEEGSLQSQAAFVLPSFMEVVERNKILVAGKKIQNIHISG